MLNAVLDQNALNLSRNKAFSLCLKVFKEGLFLMLLPKACQKFTIHTKYESLQLDPF